VGRKDLAAPVVLASRAVPENRSHPSDRERPAFRFRPQARWIDHSSQRKAIWLPRTKALRNALRGPKDPSCLVGHYEPMDGTYRNLSATTLLNRFDDHLFHISRRSRWTALLAGLRTLIQARDGPDRYVPSTFLETMPSAPSRHAWAKAVGPSSATCSLSRMPASVSRRSRASAAFRSRSGSLRRSSPSCSIRSKP
jgi:hypothetical protein